MEAKGKATKAFAKTFGAQACVRCNRSFAKMYSVVILISQFLIVFSHQYQAVSFLAKTIYPAKQTCCPFEFTSTGLK